ncbi:MAG: hypothetical protein ACJAZW_002583 [Maritalea sp.]|jgi:hypothetical protein
MFALLSTLGAFAGEWKVDKLRGSVLYLVDGEWQQLERGETISEYTSIRTTKYARVFLVRGNESMSIGADTWIKISDPDGATRTIITQNFGELIVDVEKRNVEHFEVRTPLLAAVVKGTKFKVVARNGQASVAVLRGVVQVSDNSRRFKVDVKPNQSASSDDTGENPLSVTGRGEIEEIVDTQTGNAVKGLEIAALVSKANHNGNGNAGNHENGNSGNNGNGNGNSDNNSNSGNSGNSGNNGNGNGNAGNSENGNSGNNGNGNGNAGNSENGNSGNNGNGNGNAGNNGNSANNGNGNGNSGKNG